jgi:hypothetical protein
VRAGGVRAAELERRTRRRRRRRRRVFSAGKI